MRLPRMSLAAAAAAVVAACATGPAIEPMATAPDVWVITRDSPGGSLVKDKLRADTLEQARQHCAARQAAVAPVDSQVSTGWNVTGNVPRFQLRFRCVPAAPDAAP